MFRPLALLFHLSVSGPLTSSSYHTGRKIICFLLSSNQNIVIKDWSIFFRVSKEMLTQYSLYFTSDLASTNEINWDGRDRRKTDVIYCMVIFGLHFPSTRCGRKNRPLITSARAYTSSFLWMFHQPIKSIKKGDTDANCIVISGFHFSSKLFEKE